MAALSALTAMPAAAKTACSVSQVAQLKVTMEDRQPMVPVSIDGHQERFLLDSGAFFSMISSGKARELALKVSGMPVDYDYVVEGVGGEVRPLLTTIKTVGLAGMSLKNIPFLVGGSEVANGAGLLGQNVLGFADVEYDLGHGLVRLMRVKDCAGAVPAYWAASRPVSVLSTEPRTEYQRHTIGTVFLNGVKMRAIFDTGADSTTLSLAAAARLGLKPTSPGVKANGLSGGIGRRSAMSYVMPIDSIKIGDQEEIRRTHLTAMALGMGDTDMLIGADFFLSHRVFVANSMNKMFFTYEGGAIFSDKPGRLVDTAGNTVALAPSTDAVPTDAAGFSRRGAAALARHDNAAALADFDRATTLAPTDSGYFYQRALAHDAGKQPALASADLDQALKLDPGNADARLMRAGLRLSHDDDRAGAAADVAAVESKAPPAADVRLTLADMYGSLHEPAKAVPQYTLWLRYHPDDRRKPDALNGRCWARAQLGTELDLALADCDDATRLRRSADILDSRGFVHLRMGDAGKAIRDYDAALALDAKSSWSLYGRGLAKRRVGDKAGGDADVVAAVALNDRIASRFKDLGVER